MSPLLISHGLIDNKNCSLAKDIYLTKYAQNNLQGGRKQEVCKNVMSNN